MPRAFRFAPVLLLVLPIISLPAQGAPAGPDWVRADLELSLDRPTAGRFDGNFSFFSYTLNGTAAPADGIRESLLAPEGYNVRSFLESNAQAMFTSYFTGLFPNDTLTSVDCRLDNTSIDDVAETDTYHPPIVIRAIGTIAINPGSYGLPPTADLDALAPLVLGDGAELHRDLPLNASPGHCITMTLGSFPGSVFSETGNRTIVLALDNTDGGSAVNRSFPVTLRARTPAQPGPDSLRVLGSVDLPDLSTVRISGSVEFGRADPSGYWTPPSGVLNLTSVSGATLSELVRSDILPEEQIYDFGVLPVQSALQARLASLLNVSLNFVPAWSTAGNLTCTVSAVSTNKALFGLSSTLVLGALKAGARYGFTIPVNIGWPTELEFLMPDGLRLGGIVQAGFSSGRPRFLWSDPDGLGNITASLYSALAPRYDADLVSITVVADFSDPKLDLGELLFEGSTEVPVSVDARLRMGAVAVPDAISRYLPQNLTLPYLTADMLRLLLAERLVKSGDMDALLQEIKPRLDGPMRAALGQSVQPDIRYVPETFEGYDLNRMDGSRPIEIQAWASGQKSKHIDLFKAVRASSQLTSITQDFAFKGIAGWNVTYRMRFSADTKLVSLGQKGVKAVRGTQAGRDYFEVTFGREGGFSNVTATLEPSPGLLLRSAGPVCIPTLIIVAVVFVLVFRRVRRRRRLRAAARLVTWDQPAG